MDEDTARHILAVRAAQQRARASAILGDVEADKAIYIQDSEQTEVIEDLPEEEPVAPVEEQITIVSDERPTLSQQVRVLMDEYLAAQDEILAQRQRLITHRDGEKNLTEDDLLTLQNISDLIRLRYERLLEQ